MMLSRQKQVLLRRLLLSAQNYAPRTLNTGNRKTKLSQHNFHQRTITSSASSQSPTQLAAGLDRQPSSNTSHHQNELALRHCVDIIKRLGYRMAQLDPLQLQKVDSLEQLVSGEDFALVNELRQSNELFETIFSYYVEQQCGLEFSHLTDQTEIDWLSNEWESINANFELLHEQEEELARLLLECEQFDHFLAAKFPTTKRYGCEGAESMLVVFDELLRKSQTPPPLETGSRKQGRISDLLITMPHRGRLNLLTCLLGLDPAIIFNKCQGGSELNLNEAWMACGDVLSHLSMNTRFVYGVNRRHVGLYRESPDPVNLSLLPNPSHLEVGSPMVMGAARGRALNLCFNYTSSPKFNVNKDIANRNEVYKCDDNCDDENQLNNDDHLFTIDTRYSHHSKSILPIQVHGDASLAGQGIIQETLQMSNLEQFSVGGSIHLVVNNQIGYTTPSCMGRSTRHCTDVFKMIEAPIVHVNAENISSLIKATRLAFNYRQKFHKDVAINLICFRKHGHNELDEPAFTQPLMYSNIRKRKSIPETYCDQIKMEPDQRRVIVENYRKRLQDVYNKQKSQPVKPNNNDFRNFALPTEHHRDNLISWRTGCNESLLREIGLASVAYPDHQFKVHPTLERTLIAERRARFGASQANPRVDWATAEILAIGSLLKQNCPVRLAGQDVARGTFSTRHAVLFDQETNRPYVPLNWMPDDDVSLQAPDGDNNSLPKTGLAKLEIANTILSEEAALAYEFGYSIETCQLSIWEAQFGDFFNTGQSIIDTLISSSEAKWLRQSALTLLLPHGLDGAGPEHSSSRLERFLQASKSQLNSIDTEATVNWSVCFPTLPSQYFHLLRRQVLRPFRKPLVVMSPKSIFRHPQCESQLSDFGAEKTFQPVLDDPSMSSASQRDRVNTLVLCSGKIYFQLDEIRKQEKISNVAIVRLEELCPFPAHLLWRIMKQYPNIMQNKTELVWFQEEHKNQGAYQFVAARLARLLNLSQIRYIGRDVSELPATGSGTLHKRESSKLIEEFKSLSNHQQ